MQKERPENRPVFRAFLITIPYGKGDGINEISKKSAKSRFNGYNK